MLTTTAVHTGVAYLAIDDTVGTTIAATFTNILRPIIVVAVIGLALYFVAQKQFSKVWTVVIIGAVVFALTIGSGDSSIIGKLAHWFATKF